MLQVKAQVDGLIEALANTVGFAAWGTDDALEIEALCYEKLAAFCTQSASLARDELSLYANDEPEEERDDRRRSHRSRKGADNGRC